MVNAPDNVPLLDDLNLFQVPFLCMCFQKTYRDELVKFSPMQYLQHEGTSAKYRE